MRTPSQFYLSWGGEIYGPSSREEVLAGIRTAWFEEGTLFWHEGLVEWMPLEEFSATHENSADGTPPTPAQVSRPTSPTPPASGRPEKKRPRNLPGANPAPRRLGNQGKLIFFGFALLAVGLTVGILLLLMLV
ncbi:MAG: hypothetical protein ACO3J2_01900 [Chthoniobacterales bacterium]